MAKAVVARLEKTRTTNSVAWVGISQKGGGADAGERIEGMQEGTSSCQRRCLLLPTECGKCNS